AHLRHFELVLEARLPDLKRRLQVEDRPPVLDRDHPPRGEARAVADPVDVVQDRHLGIARPQEVGVERVRDPPLDRAPCRHPRLPDHLPAEPPLPALPRAPSAEEVHLDLLQIEQADQVLKYALHPDRDSRSSAPKSSRTGIDPRLRFSPTRLTTSL